VLQLKQKSNQIIITDSLQKFSIDLIPENIAEKAGKLKLR
jgi:hypothetical protein